MENQNMGGPEEGAGATPAPAEAEESLAALTAERERLEQEKAELHEQLLRKAAEFDNFRKRIEREKREFRHSATMEVIRALLPVLDGMERALSAPPPEEARELHRGIELLQKQFRETLEKLGLAAIETEGRKFDPHLHHAVEMVESEEHDDQVILEEYQRGYLFHGRLLRPAMVRVTTRPEKE